MKTFVPVLRPVPLQYHDPREKMYSTDGIHWYYPGEEPKFDMVEAEDVGFVGSVKYWGRRFYYRKHKKCLVWKPTMPETPKG